MYISRLIVIVSAFVVTVSCSHNAVSPKMGYSEREVAGKTWYFPVVQNWKPMDMMTIEEYQSLVNSSYLIDMAPVFGYTSVLDGCPQGLVISVVSKFSQEEQSEFDFIRRSPSGVKEIYVKSGDSDSTKVLYVIYSVRFNSKITRVVTVYFKETIVGFELRNLGKCSKTADYELVEFVKSFLDLNA